MDVKFFVDENLSRDLVDGLRKLGYTNVEHILDTFLPGEKDEVWLKYVGENKLVIITKDKNIRKKPNEKALLRKYNIVAFYLGGKNVGIQQMSKQLINAWNKMEDKAKSQLKKGVAAAFIIPPKGGRLIEIPLM